MRLIDYINKSINEYSELYDCPDFFSSKRRILDHIFGVLGNGLEWAKTVDPKKGGYICSPTYKQTKDGNHIRKFDKNYGDKTFPPPKKYKEDPDYLKLSTSRWVPYPYFDKKFSPLWETDFIQEDWKQGALLWLEECSEFFSDPERIKKYWRFPNERTTKDLKEWVERNIAKGDSIEKINKDYNTTCFTGENFEEFANERWVKEKIRILQFLKETKNKLLEMKC